MNVVFNAIIKFYYVEFRQMSAVLTNSADEEIELGCIMLYKTLT